MVESGGRVSNAWVIYLEVRDSLAKAGIIPDVVSCRMAGILKVGILLGRTCRFERNPRPISLLVGLRPTKAYG